MLRKLGYHEGESGHRNLTRIEKGDDGKTYHGSTKLMSDSLSDS
jgi:hypothetical protein